MLCNESALVYDDAACDWATAMLRHKNEDNTRILYRFLSRLCIRYKELCLAKALQDMANCGYQMDNPGAFVYSLLSLLLFTVWKRQKIRSLRKMEDPNSNFGSDREKSWVEILDKMEEEQERVSKIFWVCASAMIDKLSSTEPWQDFWNNLPPHLILFKKMNLQRCFEDSLQSFDARLQHISEAAQFQCWENIDRIDENSFHPSGLGTRPLPSNPQKAADNLTVVEEFVSAAILPEWQISDSNNTFVPVEMDDFLSPKTAAQLETASSQLFGTLLSVSLSNRTTVGANLCILRETILNREASIRAYAAYLQWPRYKFMSEQARISRFSHIMYRHYDFATLCLSDGPYYTTGELGPATVARHVRTGKRWWQLKCLLGDGSLLLGNHRQIYGRLLLRMDVASIIDIGTNENFHRLKIVLAKSLWLKNLCSGLGELASFFVANMRRQDVDITAQMLYLSNEYINKVFGIGANYSLAYPDPDDLSSVETCALALAIILNMEDLSPTPKSRLEDSEGLFQKCLAEVNDELNLDEDTILNICADSDEQLGRKVNDLAWEKFILLKSSRDIKLAPGDLYCFVCLERNNIRKCTGCYAVGYCGTQHQSLDWKRHRKVCASEYATELETLAEYVGT